VEEVVLVEYFDILDCSGKKTGEVIERDEAHRTGTWHGAFHGLILYEKDNRGYVLFQKRSLNKKIAPGRFDVSVGGHYAAGEDARTAGPREIREELGLDVRFDEFISAGRRVFVYCFSPGVTEYEFQDIFLLPRKIQPEQLVLQQEEVDGVLEMDVEQGYRSLPGRLMPWTSPVWEQRVDASNSRQLPILFRVWIATILNSCCS
jgi:isopentenyldiphosphate isomerase